MSNLSLVIPRYGEVKGLPARCFTITNSERGSLGCPTKWLKRHGERLKPKSQARPLGYGSGWHDFLDEINRWWMERDCSFPIEKALGGGPPSVTAVGGEADTCIWCEEGSCDKCKGSRMSAVHRVANGWLQDGREGRKELEEVEADIKILFRAAQGYVEFYGAEPDANYRCIAVEIVVYSQVVHPLTGKPYKPKMFLIEEADGYRLPHPGEWRDGKLANGVVVSWPWFQVGKIDSVWQHRKRGGLWIREGKSSRDPNGYLKSVSVDPQTSGYTVLLVESINNGLFDDNGLFDFGHDVVGAQFDITSSSLQRYPARLKDKPRSKTDQAKEEKAIDAKLAALHEVYNDRLYWEEAAKRSKKAVAEWTAQRITQGEVGEMREKMRSEIVRWKPPAFSKSTNATTPSWLIVEALQNAQPTPDGQHPDQEDYLEHIRWARETVDLRLYARESITVGKGERARYVDELYGVSKTIAGYWRALARAGNLESLNMTFPRVPLCRLPGGHCEFIGLCAGGGADEEDLLRDFEVTTGQRWHKAKAATSPKVIDPPGDELDGGF